MTARDLITRALRLLGALGEGEVPTADTAVDALAALNDMVDSWRAERLIPYAFARVVKTLSVNVRDYTIGPGGAINVARPIWIGGAACILGGVRYPVEVLDDAGWRREQDRASTGAPVDRIYCDRAYPLATLSVLPVPSSAVVLELELPAPITGFADLSTDYTFPPGYARALLYSLAIELAPAERATVDGAVQLIARESRAVVKRANLQIPDLTIDPMIASIGGGTLDIWRG